MSDLSQIFEDTTNENEQQQEKTSLINGKPDHFMMKLFSFFVSDELKTISITDQTSSTLKNDSTQNYINKIGNELETKESVKTTENESSYENDSEYEDVVEEDEINDTSVLTSITNKSLFKVKITIFHLISFRYSLIIDNCG